MSTTDAFRQAIEAAGLTPPQALLPGKIVRFPGAGKSSGNTNGWAELFLDGQGGSFGDWGSGLSETWFASSTTQMTPREREAQKQRIAEAQQVRHEEEAKAHAKAAKQAQAIWAQAFPAPASHPYLQRKQVQPHGLRIADENRLIVPVTIGDKLSSLQFIPADGQNKKFLPGGAIKGGSYTLGDPTESTTVLICEGFATGASLHEATSLPVIIAFSAPNLLPVGQQLRQRYPTAVVVVAGDNDFHSDGKPNTGLLAAEAVAAAIGGLLAVPEVMNNDKTDWNDVHVQLGLDAVRQAIQAVLKKQEIKAMPTTPARRFFGGPEGLTKELSDEILRTQHFAKDGADGLHVYEGGAYRSGGMRAISCAVKKLLDESNNSGKWTKRREAEVAAYLAVGLPTLWEKPPLDVINVKNGLLNVTTGLLAAHSHTHYSSVQLPVVYNPEARCPEFDAFIADVFPDDCQVLAYEFIAWLITPDMSIQKAVLLRGDGANGKSVYLLVVTALLGAENVSDLSLHQIETEKFYIYQIVGKLANICSDLPGRRLESISNFKKIVGGDRLTAEKKHGRIFSFAPHVRLVFSSNHLPESEDASFAFFRRVVVVPFDRTITEAQRRAKPNILARLTTPEELSGILNRCLAVLPSLRSRGGFVQTESTTIARDEFQSATDPLAVWLDRVTVLDPQGLATKKDLWLSYSGEWNAAGRTVVPPKTLYAAIKQHRPSISESQRRVLGDRHDVFVGIRIKGSPVSGVSAVSSTPINSSLSYKTELRRSADTADTSDTGIITSGTPDADIIFDAGPE